MASAVTPGEAVAAVLHDGAGASGAAAALEPVEVTAVAARVRRSASGPRPGVGRFAMSPVARFARLPATERRVVIAALLALPVARGFVAILGFTRTYGLLSIVFPFDGAARLVGRHEIQFLAMSTTRLVAAAARHGRSGATCVPRSLVSWALLRRQGVPSDVRIGTRLNEGQFESRAWIEAGGLDIDLDTQPSAESLVPCDSV